MDAEVEAREPRSPRRARRAGRPARRPPRTRAPPRTSWSRGRWGSSAASASRVSGGRSASCGRGRRTANLIAVLSDVGAGDGRRRRAPAAPLLAGAAASDAPAPKASQIAACWPSAGEAGDGAFARGRVRRVRAPRAAAPRRREACAVERSGAKADARLVGVDAHVGDLGEIELTTPSSSSQLVASRRSPASAALAPRAPRRRRARRAPGRRRSRSRARVRASGLPPPPAR